MGKYSLQCFLTCHFIIPIQLSCLYVTMNIKGLMTYLLTWYSTVYSQKRQWGSNRTNNIDGAEPVRVSHNAILVSRMHLATMALLCKQTTDNSRTGYPPEPRWRHLLGNRILFVPYWFLIVTYELFHCFVQASQWPSLMMTCHCKLHDIEMF